MSKCEVCYLLGMAVGMIGGWAFKAWKNQNKK